MHVKEILEVDQATSVIDHPPTTLRAAHAQDAG